MGRLLSSADDAPGCAPRAVLGYGFWQRAHGGDASVVGRTIALGERRIDVVGVAPAGFHGLEVGRDFDVALPLCAEPMFSADGKGRADAGTTWWLTVFGRVPFFYYVLHIPLIHALALVVSAIRLGEVSPWLFANHPVGPPPPPDGYAWSLGLLYLIWAIAVVLLYFPCRWYAELKARRQDWWLKYL